VISRKSISGCTLAAAVLWASGCSDRGVKQVPFQAAAWNSADPGHANKQEDFRTARSHMIKDLLRRYKFTGWTRQQVVELLGQPTEKWSGFQQWDMIYVLGMERAGSLSLDDEALGFKFDANARVAKHGLSVS
jgi:hypothetical protein